MFDYNWFNWFPLSVKNGININNETLVYPQCPFYIIVLFYRAVQNDYEENSDKKSLHVDVKKYQHR